MLWVDGFFFQELQLCKLPVVQPAQLRGSGSKALFLSFHASLTFQSYLWNSWGKFCYYPPVILQVMTMSRLVKCNNPKLKMIRAAVTAHAFLQGAAGGYVCAPWAAFVPFEDAKMGQIPQKNPSQPNKKANPPKPPKWNSLQKAKCPSEKMSCAVVSMGATPTLLQG